jgi:hypothetical protein
MQRLKLSVGQIKKEKRLSFLENLFYFMGFIKLGDDLSFGYKVFCSIFIGA